MLHKTAKLIELRNAFLECGHDLRFVGGCVRDALCGIDPNDFDFATDATPDEQQKIYEKAAIKHIGTGVRHGTWTVILDKDQIYEITSLREPTRDGHQAWTRNWQDDLARRDLTINAMAMTFDDELIDPFGGAMDLQAKRVRFVGKAAERMCEDALRILRFFRFHGRFGGKVYDQEAYDAALLYAPDLSGIARERVWREIAQIIILTPTLLLDIIDIDAHRYIGLPNRDQNIPAVYLARKQTQDPVSLMAVYLGSVKAVSALAADWRWSNEELHQAAFIAENLHAIKTINVAKTKIAVTGASKHWVAETLRVSNHQLVQEIIEWTVPTFPVSGADLLEKGLNGSEIGGTMDSLRALWGESKFRLDKAQLLATLE